jgi:hypothetical protein
MQIEERNEVREMLHEILSGYQALNESQYTVMDVKLDGINKRLDVLNGKTQKTVDRVETLEKAEIVHYTACPHAPKINDRIRQIEDNQLTTKSIRNWVLSTVAITSTIIGVIWVSYQLLSKFISI